MFSVLLSFFFFQAEEGIRDLYVTGVQTCALPICPHRRRARRDPGGRPVARIPASPAAVRTNVRRLILTCHLRKRRRGRNVASVIASGFVRERKMTLIPPEHARHE